jgi:hypothetical protein
MEIVVYDIGAYKDIDIWYNLTFKTISYQKNYDLVTKDENIITDYDGSISELRINENKPPLIIGEYGFSVWNLELSKILYIDIIKLIKAFHVEDSYMGLMYIINEKLIDITKYKKLLIIHSLLICPEYRKHEITEEFIELIYRNFYDKNIAIIALVKPFQNNSIDADYFLNRKTVLIKDDIKDLQNGCKVSAVDYYLLNEFINKKDTEINEYKLFSVATKCGFSRLGNSYLFIYSPEKTINRMWLKSRNSKN